MNSARDKLVNMGMSPGKHLALCAFFIRTTGQYSSAQYGALWVCFPRLGEGRVSGERKLVILP